MPVVGAAQILVRPSFAGFQTAARREAIAGGRGAGVAFGGAFAAGAALKNIGRALFGGGEKNSLAAAQKELAAESTKAATAVQRASRKQADAVRQVQQAEAKLAEYRSKDFQTLSGLRSAEDKLARARDNLTDATHDAEKAQVAQGKALDDGQRKVDVAEKATSRGALAWKRFGGAAKVAGVAAGAAFVAIGYGAAKALASSVAPAAAFDKQIRLAGTTLGATSGQMQQLSDLAVEMGAKTSFSAKGAADALVELAKGGMDPATIAGGALQQTLTLATAGGLELGDAATYMVNGLNAFQLGAGGAKQVAAALAGGANASTASVESLGLGLAQTSAQAHIAGLSLQDTVAALAALDNAGIKGSDAGTSLKVMLQRLVPSTSKAFDEMRDLGIVTMDAQKAMDTLRKAGIKPAGTDVDTLTGQLQGYAMKLAGTDSFNSRAQSTFNKLAFETGSLSNRFFDAAGNVRSMADVSKVLTEALAGQTKEQKIATLNTLFGSDASRAAGIIAQTGAKQIGAYAAAANDQTQAELLAKSATEGFAGAQERLHGGLETVQIQMGTYLLPILTKGADLISGRLLPVVTQLVTEFGPKLGPALDRAGASVVGFYHGAQQAYDALQPFLPVIRDVGGAILAIVAAVKVYQGVSSALSWTKESLSALRLNIQLGVMRAQLIGLSIAQKAAATWSALVTAAQWAWNVALTANPIGIVVVAIAALVAGIILAYKHSATFRAIVQGAWSGIKIAVDATWQFLKNVVWPGIVAVFTAIGSAATWLWANAIKPAWDFIAGGFQLVASIISSVWHGFLSPIFELFGAIVVWLSKIAFAGAVIVMRAAWSVLSSAIQAGYNKIIKPILGFFAKRIAEVRATFALAGTLIRAAWDLVANRVRDRYNQTIRPILDALGKFVSWVWGSVIKPAWAALRSAWDTVSTKIRDGYNKTIRPILKALGDYVTGLKKTFSKAVDAIGAAWDGLKEAARKPVRFVVDVINSLIGGTDGKSGGFNSLAKKFGTSTISQIPIPKILQGKARGGLVEATPDSPILPGFSSYRQGDSLLTPVRPGEGYTVSEALRDPYERARMIALNKATVRGETAAQFRARWGEGFAKGGGYFRPVKGGSISQGLHDQYTGFPAVDFAVGTGTPVRAVADGRVSRSQDLRGAGNGGYRSYGRVVQIVSKGFETLYAHLSNRGVSKGQTVTAGATIGRSGNTGNSTGPHLHFGAKGISPYTFVGGKTSGGGTIGGIVEAVIDWAGKMKDKIAGPLKRLTSVGGGVLGEMVSKVPHKLADAMVAKAKGWVSSIAGKIGDVVTGGSNRARGLALMTAAGFGPSQWSPLNKLWTKESGWRTNAKNPSSGAYGIPQALPGSKMGSVAGDWRTNPNTQIRWGLGYIKDRYGSPANAWAHSQRTNWYENGTPDARRGWAVVGETQPELVNFRGREQVASNRQQAADLFGLQGPFEIAGTLDLGDGLSGYVAGIVSSVNDRSDRRAATRSNLVGVS